MTRKVSYLIIVIKTGLTDLIDIERMGDGKYELFDDSIFSPPDVKLFSAKIKASPGSGVVSINKFVNDD